MLPLPPHQESEEKINKRILDLEDCFLNSCTITIVFIRHACYVVISSLISLKLT